MKKTLLTVFVILASMGVFFLSLFVSLSVISFSRGFYKYEFNKYATLPYVREQAIYLEDQDAIEYVENLSEEELLNLMIHTVKYCFGLENNLNPTVNGKVLNVFREDEVSHMADVQGVFRGGIIIVGVFLLFVIVGAVLSVSFKSLYIYVRKVPFIVLGVLILLTAVLGIIIATDFEKAFDIFHMIFFNGNWQFSDGVMIAMIGDIFTDIVPIICGLFVFTLAVFTLAIFFSGKALCKNCRKIAENNEKIVPENN